MNSIRPTGAAGVFPDHASAEAALQQLKQNGFVGDKYPGNQDGFEKEYQLGYH
jgi:hypothetical protein